MLLQPTEVLVWSTEAETRALLSTEARTPMLLSLFQRYCDIQMLELVLCCGLQKLEQQCYCSLLKLCTGLQKFEPELCCGPQKLL
jgi:hypothetical protein